MERHELTRAPIDIYGAQTVRVKEVVDPYMQTVDAHLGTFILSVCPSQSSGQEDGRCMREERGPHPSSNRRGP